MYSLCTVRRNRQDRVFRAVADATRRSILERLHQRELTVLELCEPFRISQPSLSKHLAVLRRSGLIAARRSGRHRYYRLAPEPLEQIARMGRAVPRRQRSHGTHLAFDANK